MPNIPSVRTAFRQWTNIVRTDFPHLAHYLDRPVIVGLSGGADSLALLVTAVNAGLEVHAVSVDHGLQDGSDLVSERACQQARKVGATSARTIAVQCAADDEAEARAARYRALGSAAAGAPVLVAHTASDDAEGVLVSLARGSGLDSVAGMRAVTEDHPVVTAGAGWLGRPLLTCDRKATEHACQEAGLTWWEDPHNHYEKYLRSRVRHQLMPQIESIVGDHAPDALARSARQFRADSDALRVIARREMGTVVSRASNKKEPQETRLNCEKLASLPVALRSRIYKLWLADVAGPLTSAHLGAIDNLVVHWKGQQPTAIPWTADNSLQWHVEVLADLPENAGETGHSHRIGDMRRTHRLAVQRTDGELRYCAIPRRRE